MTSFDLTILEVFDQYCFGIFFGCLLGTKVYGDLLEMLFGYLLRTNGYCDLLRDIFWFLVEDLSVL